MPKVSVIIPAYNKAELTCRTINSVLSQTYQDLEVIVVDDGSKDSTRQVLSVFGNKIRYVYKDNGGACSARNEGIRQSKGQYLAFIDCDDLYQQQKIDTCVNYLEKHPHFGLVHTAAYFIDNEDRIVGLYNHPRSQKQGWVSQRLILGNYICNSTAFIRRNILDEAGVFDESIFPPADWDMWLRLADVTQVGYIPEPLTKYRVTDNFIFNRLEQALTEELYVVNKTFVRNKFWPKGLYNKALSNTHLRFFQSFWLKNELSRSQEEMKLALKINPFNCKAWGMTFAQQFFPAILYNELNRRIVRTR